MLYMVLDEKKDNYYVKIGMSRNIPQRENQYHSHSPSIVFLCSCAGTEREEADAHTFLRGISLKGGPHNEWFLVSKKFYDKCIKEGLRVVPKFANKKIYWHDKYE